MSDQEHAAEREQRLAVAARRIESGDPLAVGRLEAAALGLVERREQRRQPGPLGPFLDRVRAVEHLQILGLPDVERGRARRQQVVIDGRLGDRRRPQQRFERRPPGPVERRLGDRGMRRRAEIARHLHRQNAARLEPVEQMRPAAPDGCRASAAPHSNRSRRPAGSAASSARSACCHSMPGFSAAALASISADESTPTTCASGQREAISSRDVAGPGPEIVNDFGRLDIDPLQQVERRPQPRPGEFQVLGGIPSHGYGSPERVQAGSKAAGSNIDWPVRNRHRCGLIPARSSRSPNCQPIRLRRASAAAVHGSSPAHGTNGLRLP